uniref:Uncharacterized protein n=1 Tax=Phlebotomus papatasi TaxID=29031 RepID=A0A1B0D2X1_PHLPP
MYVPILSAGLFLECPGTTAHSLRSTLQLIRAPIQSLSVYDFDRSVTSLSSELFAGEIHIRHLQFSHSHLQFLADNSLRNLHSSLESLSIVNGKLTQVPHKALSGLERLMVLDLESNEITETFNGGFDGLHLVKLNMKSNALETIPVDAFKGLEMSLAEVDLSDNKLKLFPMNALTHLDNLRSLRVALNGISAFRWDGVSRLVSLQFLDISSNSLEQIDEDFCIPFTKLKTLSLYSNLIETVHRNAFRSLHELMSLDMSHNNIIHLDGGIFAWNKKLQTVDLSHNHIHYINGVFCNLPLLREVFLTGNNILELPGDAFTNSTQIIVIYLEANAIRRLDGNALRTLMNLEQLHLNSNFIPHLPSNFLENTAKLTSLSLDANEISELERGTFSRLNNLRLLRLQNNRIRLIRRSVFYPLPSLLELHLHNNRIGAIEPAALASLMSLQAITLQNNHELNQLESVFPADQSAIVSIQLESNEITNIAEGALAGQSSVQVLWLSNNHLQTLNRTLLRDMHHLERLYLNNNSISSISADAFQAMVVLRLLDLSHNRLEHVTRDMFSEHLVELEDLNLANNNIQVIEGRAFGKMKKLKTLDLSNNFITLLNREIFDGLPVAVLSIRNSSVSRIDIGTFRGMTNLNELNLEENNLIPADIKQLDIPSLRTLRVGSNNFTEIVTGIFDKLPSLQSLVVTNCSIQVLPEAIFAKNTNLVRIDLSRNRMKIIKRNVFSGLNVFKELRLDGNIFTDFPNIALQNISTLETLTMAKNALTSVDFFRLNGLPSLRHLDLSDNSISLVSGFNTFNLTQLDFVDLSGNILLSLPANFFQNSYSLHRVDLARNRFRQIPSSALSENSLPRLSWLNLTGNPLTEFYYGNDNQRFPHLKEIHITRTNISIVTSRDFVVFPALQHCYLVQNRIGRISPGAFSTLSQLLTLDLSLNELTILPRERLQGLKHLRMLNLSHNSLKELEEFTDDLGHLQTLDLSFNQLSRIGKIAFRHLIRLTDLYLRGNRLTTISAEAFRNLRKLNVLDLRMNYFENLPLRALRTIETHVKTLRAEDNPISCSCDTQELWEWLRDHQKWMMGQHHVHCDQPMELRGRVLFEMQPQEFCDAPLILKVAIQDIQPYSVIVSWQSREYTGLTGYHVVFHPLDILGNEIFTKTLNRSASSTKLVKLASSTRYRICVLGIGNWVAFQQAPMIDPDSTEWSSPNQISSGPGGDYFPGELERLLSDNATTKCQEVTTLDASPSLMMDDNGVAGQSFIHSILTRRLGLIVGCVLGIIVFIVLISVLGWLKLKKQRIIEANKRLQPMQPEFITYRHFSIPNEEANRVDNCHPNFIATNTNLLGMTTLNA